MINYDRETKTLVINRVTFENVEESEINEYVEIYMTSLLNYGG